MVATNYLWDMVNDNILAETDVNGDLAAEYTYEPDHFGKLISQDRDGAESFYHFDGQGSTRALTDENGDVTDRYAYRAFGEEVSKTGVTENPYRYVGEKGYNFDEETEDHYVRVRSYQPTTARWLTRDPAAFSDGPNWYAFVRSNPGSYADPSGRLSEGIVADPDVGPCGSYTVQFEYTLAPDERDGWIIQEVEESTTVSPCHEGAAIESCTLREDPVLLARAEALARRNLLNTPPATGHPCPRERVGDTLRQRYFEMWEVRRGVVFQLARPIDPQRGAGDMFAAFGFRTHTHGFSRKYGYSYFVDRHRETDFQRRQRAKFRAGPGRGVPEAGILRSACWDQELQEAYTIHSLTGVSHEYGIKVTSAKEVTKSWYCCCDPPDLRSSLLNVGVAGGPTAWGSLALPIPFFPDAATLAERTDC